MIFCQKILNYIFFLHNEKLHNARPTIQKKLWSEAKKNCLQAESVNIGLPRLV